MHYFKVYKKTISGKNIFFSSHESVTLVPALHINEHDYSPGDFVVRSSPDRALNEFGSIAKVFNEDKQVELVWHNSDHQGMSEIFQTLKND